ncbi:MAG: universal stress protein [Thermodesulfobacteriota bacterium]|nr:universal stress protein [Thermodesulfobacteriota bacterium]
MADVKKILFAVELSTLVSSIADWVNLMGRQFNAEVHLLHVVPELDYWGVAYAVSPTHLDDKNKIIKEAENKLEAFRKENMDAALDVRCRVVVGYPAEEIINYIDAENMSMVVMGTHGKSGLDRAIFGSVADRVLRFSPAPVFSVNPHSL